jgi:hypothetical protein
MALLRQVPAAIGRALPVSPGLGRTVSLAATNKKWVSPPIAATNKQLCNMIRGSAGNNGRLALVRRSSTTSSKTSSTNDVAGSDSGTGNARNEDTTAESLASSSVSSWIIRVAKWILSTMYAIFLFLLMFGALAFATYLGGKVAITQMLDSELGRVRYCCLALILPPTVYLPS